MDWMCRKFNTYDNLMCVKLWLKLDYLILILSLVNPQLVITVGYLYYFSGTKGWWQLTEQITETTESLTIQY